MTLSISEKAAKITTFQKILRKIAQIFEAFSQELDFKMYNKTP